MQSCFRKIIYIFKIFNTLVEVEQSQSELYVNGKGFFKKLLRREVTEQTELLSDKINPAIIRTFSNKRSSGNSERLSLLNLSRRIFDRIPRGCFHFLLEGVRTMRLNRQPYLYK